MLRSGLRRYPGGRKEEFANTRQKKDSGRRVGGPQQRRTPMAVLLSPRQADQRVASDDPLTTRTVLCF